MNTTATAPHPAKQADAPMDPARSTDTQQDVISLLDQMTAPKAFDELCSNRARSLAALAVVPTTDLGRLRRLQLIFAHDPAYPCDRIQKELEELSGVPKRSLRLMIQIEYKLYEEVLRADCNPRSMDPLELEDASKALAMQGSAATSLNRPQVALEHLRAAIALARACGTTYRLRTMLMDWFRAQNQIGEPDPDGLELLLLEPLSARGRQFGQRIRAQSLLAVGAYEDAIRALGPVSQDDTQDAAMREFLHALIGVPPLRDDDDPLIDETRPYNRLAKALWATRHKRKPLDLASIQGEPYVSYARFIEAQGLLNVDGMARSVLAKLGDMPPASPEQALAWSLITLRAALQEDLGVTALRSVIILDATLKRLRSPASLGKTARTMSPDLLLLLLLGPFGKQVNGLAELPILAGQTIIHEGNRIKLPGRTGREVLLQAAHHPEAEDVTRAERKRLTEALVGFGGAARVANLGTALRHTVMLYRAARKSGDETMTQAWADAYAQGYALLSPDIQSLFAQDSARSLL